MLIQATHLADWKVHVDNKLDNNNVQLQTIYRMYAFQSYTMLFNELGDRNIGRHGEFKDFHGPV